MDPLIVRQRIPMEDPVVSLCYVTSYDVTLYGASCGMPKCSCDVKYPMVYSMVWILLSYAKGFLWRSLWCPYTM
ncbi:hypothetical protein CEXT_19661 [Caerostris extrusa]|uniref:Uncharacterized protein n=1 Tax=Caerostris extrusa TaxID=172846 RepID=A0AAV4TPT1_CAEEX|nr:hypothetical protein CEXT_19661 [Caerostris extrusa]